MAPRLTEDVVAVWRPWVDAPLAGAPVESGHHMAEENPRGLAALLIPFLAQTRPGQRPGE